jgi:hypothetical protein
MLLPSALPFLLLSLSLSVLAKDHIITSAPSPTSVIVERDFLSSASPGCSTVSGLAVPQPSGLTCGVPAISNFGGFIIAYSSPSPYVLALVSFSLLLYYPALSSIPWTYFMEGCLWFHLPRNRELYQCLLYKGLGLQSAFWSINTNSDHWCTFQILRRRLLQVYYCSEMLDSVRTCLASAVRCIMWCPQNI